MTPIEGIGLMFLIAVLVIGGSMFITPVYWTPERINEEQND